MGLALSLSAFAADKVPSWMTTPPPDDAQSWYGTGEGPDLETARRGALRFVAAKLRVTIQGQISNTVRASSQNGKEQVSSEALSSVTESVAQTDFTRFDVVQSAKGGLGVFVLVKVDKPAFVADTRNQLQVVDKPVREAEARLPSLSPMEQYMALRRVRTQIETGTRLSMLLQGAGAEDEGRAGVLRYGVLLQTSNELATKLTFELRAPADPDIAAAIAAYLSEQGIRTVSTRTPGANAVTVQSDGRQADFNGDKMLKMKVRLAVLDDQGRAAGTREYDVTGTSRFDFKGSREDAVRKLTAMMRKLSPLAALGVKE